MAANSFLKIFMPKDKVFYSLFEQVSDRVLEMSVLLKDLVDEPDFNKRGVILIKNELQV